jgi:kynurenine formamidase
MSIDDLRVVDLTQPLQPDVVMWPGVPGPTFETLVTVVPDGFYSRRMTVAEHTGTHFDAPAHMVEGAALLHQVDPATLIRPVVVIDISARIAGDPDGILTLDDVTAFEAAHGRIPAAAAVFLRTGWEAFNADPLRYAGAPGDLRFPGFGPDAARFLVDERGVVGLGIDTLGIDAGFAADFVVHRQVSHPRGVWHLEGLQNLAALPPVGAWVFVGVLNLVDGSGSPARVLALVP